MTDKKMNVWQRFAAAKAAMPAPVKDTKGYGYQYATLAQVRSIVMPALIAQDLDAVQYQELGLLYTLVIDGETGAAIITDTRLLGEGDDQQRGSSETYQRRYALLTVCGLAPEDDDGQAAKGAPPQGGLDALGAAKLRAGRAINAYALANGGDAKAIAASAKERDDYEETPEWYDMIAKEYETA